MISLDFETYSEVDILKAGASRYAEDSSTEILCFSYAIGEDDPKLWIPGDIPPHDLLERTSEGVSAFNALFEIQIWRNICVKRFGWPDIPLENWYDTQADCLALALPDSLDKAAKAIGLPVEKDRKGKLLINKLCKPRKPTKKNPATRILRKDDLKSYLELYQYCKQDVIVERTLRQKLPYLQTADGIEREIWLSTILANQRGIPLDTFTLDCINRLIAEKLLKLNEEIFLLTNEEITSINQNAAIQAYLNDNFPVTIPNMQGDTITRLLKKELPDQVRDILFCYAQGNYASIKKFQKMSIQLCSDGTIKDNYQYHGAGTGRDAGRGVQVQNLPRASVKDPEFAIEVVRESSLNEIEGLYGNVLELASALCRPILCAPEGMAFMDADYTQIENIVGADIAGEKDILELYNRGENYYLHASSELFNVPFEELSKKHPLYMAGKITSLSSLFGGGAMALVSMAKKYGYNYKEEEAQTFVNAFREKRPRLVATWKSFGTAARKAVQQPDHLCEVEMNTKFSFLYHGDFLYLQLANGRKLVFPYPKWEQMMMPWGKPGWTITHMWVNTMKGRRWERRSIHGASLFQSAVQGTARDILMEGVLRLEKEGYPHVMRTHDQATCLLPDDERYSLDYFASVFAQAPAWGPDMPISCDPWKARRFKK